MDKVIIDGIDVSECKYNKGYCRISALCDYSGHICEVDHDCYYKQLKRLQAEYDDLHLTYAGCKTANTGLQELNQKLEQENEKLKQVTNESIIEQEKFVAKVNKLEQENKRLKLSERDLSRICQAFKKDIETEKSYKLKYYKALQEIRDIVSKIIDSYIRPYGDFDQLKTILDKINEVIGAE